MRFKIIAYTICILTLNLLQTTVLEHIEIYHVKPNLPLVFIVSIALLTGHVEGAVVGFFMGLTWDMLSGGLLGFHALLGIYLGLVVGLLNRRLYRENLMVVVFFSFVSTLVYEFIVFFLYMLGGGMNIVYAIKDVIFPEALYNCVAAIPIFIVCVRLSYKFEEVSRSLRKY